MSYLKDLLIKNKFVYLILGLSFIFSSNANAIIWNEGVRVKKVNSEDIKEKILILNTDDAPQTVFIPVSVPTVVSIPDPVFITPWQDVFLKEDLILSALEKYKNWSLSLKGSAFPIRYYIDENLPKENIEAIKLLAEEQIKSFGSQGVQDYSIIAGATDLWVNNKIKELKINFEKIENCPDTMGNRYCTNGNNVALIVVTNPDNNIKRLTEISASSHEYFHIVAAKKMNGFKGNYDSIPAWFTEGVPQFFSGAVGDRTGVFKYSDMRKEILSVGHYENYLRKSLSSYQTNSWPEGYVYGIGQVAVEYIVASCGMECVISIYENLGKNITFDQSFELATNVKLKDFYSKFDALQFNIGIKSKND